MCREVGETRAQACAQAYVYGRVVLKAIGLFLLLRHLGHLGFGILTIASICICWVELVSWRVGLVTLRPRQRCRRPLLTQSALIGPVGNTRARVRAKG